MDQITSLISKQLGPFYLPEITIGAMQKYHATLDQKTNKWAVIYKKTGDRETDINNILMIILVNNDKIEILNCEEVESSIVDKDYLQEEIIDIYKYYRSIGFDAGALVSYNANDDQINSLIEYLIN